jgi:hypothetical protein
VSGSGAGEPLLDLHAAGIHISQTRELANPKDSLIRNVADVAPAIRRQQVLSDKPQISMLRAMIILLAV